MKIVVLGPAYPYRGGIATYHTLLTQKLLESHQVQCISFSRQYPGWLYPGKTDKDYSQKAPGFPVTYLLDSVNPWSWFRTAAWICQQKPDLLLIEWWVTFLAPAYWIIATLCRRKGIKVLYNIHNVFPHEGGMIHRPLAYLALKQAHCYLTHTPAQEQALLDLLPKATVETCPLPIFPGEGGLLTQAERDLARQQLGMPSEARIILFFGIVRAYKGLMVLLEAVSLLKELGEPVYLLVAGEFWEKKDIYQAEIKRLGIMDFIRLEDRFIPDGEVRRYFAAADIAVAPYTGGTQSAIVSLARGFGIPIVMTDRSAAGMDLTSIDPQTLARAGDVYGLAQAIEYSLKHLERGEVQPLDGWQEVVGAIENLAQDGNARNRAASIPSAEHIA